MNLLNFILLQATDPNAGGGYSGFIMIIAMIVIFYFFMIRPQSKKQKEIKKAREAMKKGDKVVTAGGIHGRIKEMTDTIVSLEIAPGVVIKVDKASVFAEVAAPAQSSAKKDNQNKEEKTVKGKNKKEETVEEADDETVVDDNGSDLSEAAGKVAKKK